VEVREAVAIGRLAIQPDGLTVAFLDQSQGPFTSRRWEFGDGHTSQQASVSHRYAREGTYMPRLVVGYPGAGGVAETRVAELGPLVLGTPADDAALVGLSLVQANAGDSQLAARRRTGGAGSFGGGDTHSYRPPYSHYPGQRDWRGSHG